MLPYEKKIAEAKDLEEQARSLREQADRIKRDCDHKWGPVEYTPDYQEAYTIPGDPPGTMGVDWQGPVYVPAKTTPKWSRRCLTCGCVQTTERKKTVGGPLSHEEPDFGDR